MDIEFDFKGDPIGGVITNCKLVSCIHLELSCNLFMLKTIIDIKAKKLDTEKNLTHVSRYFRLSFVIS